jgi:hypothetical protein
MACPAERTRVIPGVIALVLALAGPACGSISTLSPSDGSPPESRPEVAMTKGDAGSDARPEAAGADAGTDRAVLADGGAEVAPMEVHPDVDTGDCTLKINEVQTGGPGGALDEFVEIYNTCPDREFPLAGYKLAYRSDVGVTNVSLIVFGAQSVASGHPFFLCANGGATYTGPPADAYFTASSLRDVGGGLAVLGPSGAIVDSVGWGTATNAFVEGMPAAAPAAGQSIARVPDGHDTGVNMTDFLLKTAPTPGAAN